MLSQKAWTLYLTQCDDQGNQLTQCLNRKLNIEKGTSLVFITLQK